MSARRGTSSGGTRVPPTAWWVCAVGSAGTPLGACRLQVALGGGAARRLPAVRTARCVLAVLDSRSLPSV